MRIINKTPHQVVIYRNGSIVATIEPTGTPVRCTQRTVVIGEIDGIPITKVTLGEVENLPEKEEGTILIVSRIVAESVDRDDLYIPGPAVRNEAGQIVGCQGLSKI